MAQRFTLDMGNPPVRDKNDVLPYQGKTPFGNLVDFIWREYERADADSAHGG